jgi:hypothetical protein
MMQVEAYPNEEAIFPGQCLQSSPGTRDTLQTASMQSYPQQTGNQEQERLRILAQIPDPWLKPRMATDWVGGCNVECSDFDLNV